MTVLQTARAALGLHTAFVGGEIYGWDTMARGLANFLTRVDAAAHSIDARALNDMVALAKSRVPVDTGRLLNGITGEIFDNYAEFLASAVHETGSREDYARFVEFGTSAGTRGVKNAIVADEGFYSADPFSTSPLRGRRVVHGRISYRTHSGAPAQPYFYGSANEVLEKRGLEMQDVAADSASAEGFPLA